MIRYAGYFEEIRSLEVDFNKDILKINGKEIKDRPAIVTLPGPEGWPLRKVFNAELMPGSPGRCDRINVAYEPASSSKLL